MTFLTPRALLVLVGALAVLAGCFTNPQVAPNSGAVHADAAKQTAALPRRFRLHSLSVVGPDVERELDRAFRTSGRLRGLITGQRHLLGPDASADLLFVSDFKANVVDEYDISKRPPVVVNTIGGLNSPQGLTIDASLNLYIANTQAQDVPVYAPPYNGKPRLLNDVGNFPVGVAVDASGNTYVANINSFSGGGNVVRFAKGSLNGVQIGDPLLIADYFIAVDSHGHLFVDGLNGSQLGELDESSDGGKTWANTGATLAFPGGVAIDAANEVLVDDQNTNVVSAYTCSGASCSLVRSTKLSGASNVVSFKLASTQTDLWAADAVKATAVDYSYPAGSPLETVSGFGEPIDTALVGLGAPPTPTPTPTISPTPTPKPTKKPTPTPSPSPTPVSMRGV